MDNRLRDCLENWDSDNRQVLPDEASSHLTEIQVGAINRINLFINGFRHIRESKDHWKNITEFFRDGGGDCEDFAIAKGTLMRQMFPNMILELIICLDLYTRRAHAILCVHAPDRIMYLDNIVKIPYGKNYYTKLYSEFHRITWPKH